MAIPLPAYLTGVRALISHLLGLVCALGHCAAYADSDSRLQAGVAWQDNPGHALVATSRSSDRRADLGADLSLRRYPGDFDTLALQVAFDASQYSRHPGLDQAALALQFSETHASGLGPGHPWLRVSLKSAHVWYQDALRDGWQFRAALATGVRVNARCDVAADVHAERRTQDRALPDGPDLPGTVYAQGRQGFDLEAHQVLTRDWTGGLAWHWLRGDFDAVVQGDLASYGGVAAYAADPAFGSIGYGYRYRALSQGLDLVLSRALDGHSSLNLLLRSSRTLSAQGTQYPDRESGVVYVWRP